MRMFMTDAQKVEKLNALVPKWFRDKDIRFPAEGDDVERAEELVRWAVATVKLRLDDRIWVVDLDCTTGALQVRTRAEMKLPPGPLVVSR